MNIKENERFHVLAHKALSKQATPTEQRELRSLITENPKLKEEIEELGGEATIIRELLPLLEELEQPPRGVPRPLMERLNREVGEVLDSSRKSKGDLRELLGKLEDWAHRHAGASREEVMALVAVLRGSILPEEGVTSVAHMATLRSPLVAYDIAPTLCEEAEANAIADESHRRQSEMEARLQTINARLQQAEEISRECREELRRLLELMAQEREAGLSRRRTKANLFKKGKS